LHGVTDRVDHPIVPVIIGDAAHAPKMVDLLLEKGVYRIGFSYPVVPVGKARIRTQVSAAHSHEDLQTAATACAAVRAEMSSPGVSSRSRQPDRGPPIYATVRGCVGAT
jgi:glycine C-acetyltransferase